MALPVLIHLLNRLRYRSVKWAAMMFLLSATKSSIRRARLRHYMILALRTLALLFLLLALARPIAGGWLGAVAGGAPETIFLALDRSASMEAVGNTRKSTREHALELFSEGAGLLRGNVRYVLAESAGLSVQEVQGADSLAELSLCQATSSAADMPALFSKILEYAVENRCGDMELWVASDMQASNWRLTSPEWQSLKERYGALPQDVRIRVLSLAPPMSENIVVDLTDSRRTSRASGDVLLVTARLERNMPGASVVLPVTLAVEDVGEQEDVEVEGASTWLMKSVPIASDDKAAGWGSIEIPADGNAMDNKCYYTYGGQASELSLLVADAGDAARILSIASAPDPKGMNQACLRSSPASLGEVEWSQLAMLVWQDASAGSGEALIEGFCRQGGTVVIFPPGRKSASILGLEWGDVETASGDTHFSVVSWESMEGPLARTGDGKDLPVASMSVKKRQGLGQVNEDLFRLRTYASYRDGRPFLQGAGLGRGHVYICTTLPSKGWSDLARGTVLVPVMQRLLARGAVRLGGAENGSVGMAWKASGAANWTSITGEGKDPSRDAGVYQIDGKLVALNVPAAEHDLELVQEDQLRRALDGLELEFVDSNVGEGRKNTASEIWPLFVFLMGMSLLGEALMLSGDRLIERKEVPDDQ